MNGLRGWEAAAEHRGCERKGKHKTQKQGNGWRCDLKANIGLRNEGVEGCRPAPAVCLRSCARRW